VPGARPRPRPRRRGGELEPSMSDDERAAFERSVETLRDAAQGLGVT
jgi:hypothetical protein